MADIGAKQPRPGSDAPIRPLSDTFPPMAPTPPLIRVNRAPVLTLWATVVAKRLGYPPETALTLGRFVAGSSARWRYAGGRAISGGQERTERAERDRAVRRSYAARGPTKVRSEPT
jgi:hypothetical protein